MFVRNLWIKHINIEVHLAGYLDVIVYFYGNDTTEWERQ
jgi:hypothetical protein